MSCPPISLPRRSIAWNRGDGSSSSAEDVNRVVFSAETWGHIERVASILSHFSRADPFVKGAMAHEGVLNAMMKVGRVRRAR